MLLNATKLYSHESLQKPKGGRGNMAVTYTKFYKH